MLRRRAIELERNRQDFLEATGVDGGGRATDLVILLMGQTRAGKSTLVNTLLGWDCLVVGHSLDSTTRYTQAVTLDEAPSRWVPLNQVLKSGNRRIILVDTPGIDNMDQTEEVVLAGIVTWLRAACLEGMQIAGRLYIHAITGSRWGGTVNRDLRTFRNLCRTGGEAQAAFLTTKWEDLKDLRDGILRVEGYVADQWADFINGAQGSDKGGALIRHLWPEAVADNLTPRDASAKAHRATLAGVVDSAWSVIQELVVAFDTKALTDQVGGPHGATTRIQEELNHLVLFECETKRIALGELLREDQLLRELGARPGDRRRKFAKEIAILTRELKSLEPKSPQRLKGWWRGLLNSMPSQVGTQSNAARIQANSANLPGPSTGAPLVPPEESPTPPSENSTQSWKGEVDDIVLFVIGGEAAGKSTFINHVLDEIGHPTAEQGGSRMHVRQSLESKTTNPAIVAVRLSPAQAESRGTLRRVVLVEVPFLADQKEAQHQQIVRDIETWFATCYPPTMACSLGIIFVQDMSMHPLDSLTAMYNIKASRSIAETIGCQNIVVATMKWNKIDPAQVSLAEKIVSVWPIRLAAERKLYKIETGEHGREGPSALAVVEHFTGAL